MTATKPTSRFAGRPAQRLTIWLSVRDRHQHTSLEVELMRRARHAGLAGATVFGAEIGYGPQGRVRREHLLSDDRPLAIVIIESAARVESFLETLEDLRPGVVATVEDVEIVDVGQGDLPS